MKLTYEEHEGTPHYHKVTIESNSVTIGEVMLDVKALLLGATFAEESIKPYFEEE